MDEMLFGKSADPIETLTRLGTHLAAGAPPPLWLHSLRATLGVPGIALCQDGATIAAAGSVGTRHCTRTSLRAGSEQVGDLVVCLPPGHLRLPPAAAAVVDLVTAPLAQALHAARLSEQLRLSRGRVVTALEEERRRMRRDLHDGLGPTLTGIARHADVATATLELPLSGTGSLRVVVADTGRCSTPWTHGVGIRSMHERVEQIGGTLSIRATSQGATIEADLPLAIPA